LISAFGSTVILNLANPATLLSFAALCAGFGIGTSIQGAQIPIWIAGVFVGSAAWWLFLSGSVGAFRHTLTPEWMKWVNRISGGIVTLFGITAVNHAVQVARLRS
jgi:threonine/homoserine/homoserine lactone efflux protein